MDQLLTTTEQIIKLEVNPANEEEMSEYGLVKKKALNILPKFAKSSAHFLIVDLLLFILIIHRITPK